MYVCCFVIFCFLFFCFFSLVLFVLVLLYILRGCASSCGHSCLVQILFSPFLPVLGFVKPSGEPVVPRGPQLSTLSPYSFSCFSPVFPRCRPNPLAANRKPERHRHLSKRQLCHGGRRGRLRQPVPHAAVLPVHWVALQQVGPGLATWGRPGSVSISGQHPEGPKVRQNKSLRLRINSGFSVTPFCSLFTLTKLTEGQIRHVYCYNPRKRGPY